MIGGEGSPTRLRPELVLEIEGELDVAAAAAAYKRMIERDLPPGGRLVLDLSGITFMDSTGIRLILQAREHALQRDATFVVVRPQQRAMRVLELVGLDEQLDIVDPEE